MVNIRLALSGVLVAGLILAAGGEVSAQATTSTLIGDVRDTGGDPVSDAIVQARSEKTGAVRTGLTDEKGGYRIDGLAPGGWTVVARLGGGLSDSRTVTLRLQQTLRLDFTVHSGAGEHVIVRAEAPLVDRKATAGSLRIDAETIDTLPMAGRSFTDLAMLDSSVRAAAPGNFYGERGAVFSVNGQSGRSNSFLVDGLDNNDQVSGTTLNSSFSQQVVDEFVLLTNGFAPEFGRASGGVLNIVTKQGTNDRTYGAFLQGTVDWANSTGQFVESLPDSGSSQETPERAAAGVTFGGPIVREKAFYFIAYEHQSLDDLVAYTGVDREGTRGGRFVAPNVDDNLFARFDFNLGAANKLMFRISGDDRSSDGINVGGVATPESGFRIDEQDYQFAATLTSVISPKVLSESRLLFGRSTFDQYANSDRPGVSHPSGIFGGSVLNRQKRNEETFQLVQNVTWVEGRHTMKFGFDVLQSATSIATRFNPKGNLIYDYDFPFDPGDCGGVSPLDVYLAEEAAGDDFDGTVHPLVPCNEDGNGNGVINEPANIFSYPTVYTIVDGNPTAQLDDTRIAVFAQDRWQIGNRWVIDYGLRYDLSTYELPSSAVVESSVPNGGATRDTDNIAPRFGFTVMPFRNGKTVIRGGAGIFYDKLVLAFPAIAAVTSGTEIRFTFPQGFAFEITEDVVENQFDEVQDGLGELDQITMRFSTATELSTPYTKQYNLGVETPVGKRGAFRADLIHSLGYNQPLMKDINPVAGFLPPLVFTCSEENIDPEADSGLPCHLPDPEHGSLAVITTEGQSWYSGLDLEYRWQGQSAWFRTSYTLSKAEDMGFDPLKGGISLPPDSNDLSGERGRADGDRRHRLVLAGDAPLFGLGFRASTVVQYSTGLPYNVTTGQDDNLDGILSDRPAGVGRNEGADSSLEAINEVREQAVVDLAPVTSLEEPTFFQIDLRLYRPFMMGKGAAGEVFLQIFNLLDEQNVGIIEGRAISPYFGQPVALAGPPRTVELGLKLGF